MTTYLHLCESCKHEWEQVYGMKEEPPTLCPDCGIDGCVKRLITGGSGPGIVKKTGAEIKAGMATETRKIKERAATDENFRANLIGESAYHQDKLTTDDLQKELISIGKSASAIKSTDVKSNIRPKIKTGKDKKTKK